ncbi:MAG: Hsp20/alpha crystallin family protein [Cryomorphaceae bacterium]|jgi:HSP20 family protein|nr:Hsp20/alpha crystallin family protein [Cryomorphaceae bacterium]MBT3685028.1 Hsp20/alpha crystallin family protein [Cryomorphaceae bacterium]MBT4813439.1 Hsp20/alpha crystallin family protein [Cryomorphaceae bacterium]MBT6224044.1 Hsp20/alpha crystallin family protein [Cryomorphaceae bacterium]MBT6729899.1 Hsp20/alpha crystallin family protein [Cryomorphaceae bacterium]
MRIVKYNNNNKVFPSLMNQFFNDDLRMNVINNNHSVPSVNSIENDNSFEIDLAVPGMKKDDFTIQLNDKVLVISSENTNSVENNSMSLNEFNYSSFQRSFIVPETVELDKIKANYKNGILKVKLPKKKDSISKPNRVIDIS